MKRLLILIFATLSLVSCTGAPGSLVPGANYDRYPNANLICVASDDAGDDRRY